MRRSAIIFTTIVSMVLCVSLLAFSVYAHLTQTFSVSNTIGFNPDDNVYVALECRISGAVQTSLTTPPRDYDSVEDYLYAVGIYQDVGRDGTPLLGEEGCTLTEWHILESLDFASVTQPIVYTITIYNYSDMPIRVSISDYLTNSEHIRNEVSEPVEIEGYKHDDNPSSAQVWLSTTIADTTSGFSDVQNNFTVLFETTVA